MNDTTGAPSASSQRPATRANATKGESLRFLERRFGKPYFVGNPSMCRALGADGCVVLQHLIAQVEHFGVVPTRNQLAADLGLPKHRVSAALNSIREHGYANTRRRLGAPYEYEFSWDRIRPSIGDTGHHSIVQTMQPSIGDTGQPSSYTEDIPETLSEGTAEKEPVCVCAEGAHTLGFASMAPGTEQQHSPELSILSTETSAPVSHPEPPSAKTDLCTPERLAAPRAADSAHGTQVTATSTPIDAPDRSTLPLGSVGEEVEVRVKINKFEHQARADGGTRTLFVGVTAEGLLVKWWLQGRSARYVVGEMYTIRGKLHHHEQWGPRVEAVLWSARSVKPKATSGAMSAPSTGGESDIASIRTQWLTLDPRSTWGGGETATAKKRLASGSTLDQITQAIRHVFSEGGWQSVKRLGEKSARPIQSNEPDFNVFGTNYWRAILADAEKAALRAREEEGRARQEAEWEAERVERDRRDEEARAAKARRDAWVAERLPDEVEGIATSLTFETARDWLLVQKRGRDDVLTLLARASDPTSPYHRPGELPSAERAKMDVARMMARCGLEAAYASSTATAAGK